MPLLLKVDNFLCNYRNLYVSNIQYHVLCTSRNKIELGFNYNTDDMCLHFDNLRNTVRSIISIMHEEQQSLKINTECSYLGNFETYFIVEKEGVKFYNYIEDDDFMNSLPRVQFELNIKDFLEIIELFYLLKTRC